LRNTAWSLGVSVLVILGCGGGGGDGVSEEEAIPVVRYDAVGSLDTAVEQTDTEGRPIREIPPFQASYGILGSDIACPKCTASLADVGADFHAGSTLQGNYAVYGPKRAFDGDPTTAWCEDEDDLGEGIGIEVTFNQPVHLAGMYVLGGYFKDRATLESNARISLGQVLISGPRNADVVFDDPTIRGQDNLTGEPITKRDEWFERVRSAPAMWTPPTEWQDEDGRVLTEFFSLNIKEAYEGSKYEDNCISEIRLVFEATREPEEE